MKLFTHSQTSMVHKAITGTNVDQPTVRSCGIPLRVILQDILKISVLHMSLKIMNLRLQPHCSGPMNYTSTYLLKEDSVDKNIVMASHLSSQECEQNTNLCGLKAQ